MTTDQRCFVTFPQLPDDVLVQVVGFLGSVGETLKLSGVCTEWRLALQSANPVWNRFLHELDIPNVVGDCFSPRQNKHTCRSTRLRSNFKHNFIVCAEKQRNGHHMSHQQLLLKIKNLFEHNKRDCKRLLQKIIRQYFPGREFTKHFNVNARSDLLEGYSLLNLAARYGRYSCINFILSELNAYPDTEDNGGFTPFLNACYRGDLAIVKLLLSKGASPNAQGCLR